MITGTQSSEFWKQRVQEESRLEAYHNHWVKECPALFSESGRQSRIGTSTSPLNAAAQRMGVATATSPKNTTNNLFFGPSSGVVTQDTVFCQYPKKYMRSDSQVLSATVQKQESERLQREQQQHNLAQRDIAAMTLKQQQELTQRNMHAASLSSRYGPDHGWQFRADFSPRNRTPAPAHSQYLPPGSYASTASYPFPQPSSGHPYYPYPPNGAANPYNQGVEMYLPTRFYGERKPSAFYNELLSSKVYLGGGWSDRASKK